MITLYSLVTTLLVLIHRIYFKLQYCILHLGKKKMVARTEGLESKSNYKWHPKSKTLLT